MFTLGIPLKQKRRTLGYLSNEYFPGGMKKLGQVVDYEILLTDDGFFQLGFPGMDEDEFRDITFKLKQQGVTVIGADSQLTENNIMKLVNLVPLKESLQVTTNDGKVAIISDPEDIKTFYRGGTVFGDDSDGDSIELSKETSLDFQSITQEGSCGYAPEGEDPNKADQPAGPHLLRKKIKEIIQEKMKHPQYRDASNQYAQRGKSTRLSPEKKAAQRDSMRALAQRIKDLDKEKDIDESYVDDPNVPGVTGMEDAVNDPNAKAEKILMSLAKSFGNIPLEKVVNDSTYKRQAITSILFGMMNEDAS